MKKSVCFLICLIILLVSVSSCASDEQSITKENVLEYVSIDLTFGEVVSTPTSAGYNYSCICYVNIKPNSDYYFTDCIVEYTIPDNKSWAAVNKSDSKNTLLSWRDAVHLDKDGYGVATVFLSYNGAVNKLYHPMQLDGWSVTIISASGSCRK